MLQLPSETRERDSANECQWASEKVHYFHRIVERILLLIVTIVSDGRRVGGVLHRFLVLNELN